MFAIRARRKVATERDFLDAVDKVVRQGTKFSSTYVSCRMLCGATPYANIVLSQAIIPSVQLDLILYSRIWQRIIVVVDLCFSLHVLQVNVLLKLMNCYPRF
jgi:hypothetical protein